MELGLYLSGSLTDGSLPAGWLHRTQQWLHESWTDTLVASEIRKDDSETPVLCFQLHPSAADVEITAREPSRVMVSARTSAAGPGYHAHVCELLRTLGNVLAVFWDPPSEEEGTGDETGYFFTSDRSALERAVLEWLRGAARAALQRASESGSKLALSLPDSHTFEFDGAIATPLGPRDADWLHAVADDPVRGIDMFPWWEPGQGAQYRLGRALAEMWTGVRWRKPESENESAQLKHLVTLLREAHAENPELSYPWREWEELRSYLEGESPLPQHEQVSSGALVGYRRRNVRVRLTGGWSISLPGFFADSWEGDGTYCAWGKGKTVWFSSLEAAEGSAAQSAEALLPELDTGERPLEIPGLPSTVACRAGIAQYAEEGESVQKLNARLALPGRLVLFTVVFDHPEDKAWAIRTIESVRHPDAAAAG